MKEELERVFTNSFICSYNANRHQICYKSTWWYVCNEVNNYSACNSIHGVRLTANSLEALKTKMELL